MTGRKKNRGKGPRSSAGTLAQVTALGGRTRKHKYLRDIKQYSLPVLILLLFQTSIYVFLTARPERVDWVSIWTVACVLGFVPIFASFVLTAFRRHEAPIVSATVVSLVLYSVAVSFLSALRIPVSYVAIAACLPVGVVLIAYANIKFHRTATVRAAIAPFARANDVLELIGVHIPVLSGPGADLSNIDVLLIDPHAHHNEMWSGLLAQCYLGGIEIMPWTRYVELWHGRLDVNSFDVSHIVYSPSQLLYAQGKRIVDMVAVLISLPLTLPLGIIVAAYIFLQDGAPVLFNQDRRGFGGRTFRMYKFRTMFRGTTGGATAEVDHRIIPGCGILRKLRLDELPQLYNILIGNMSLIGPRPESVELADWYEQEIPKYKYRLLVLPGLTGWAQVNHGYTSNPAEAKEKLAYDLYYIKNLSFDLEILIMFKTIRTVIFGQGAR